MGPFNRRVSLEIKNSDFSIPWNRYILAFVLFDFFNNFYNIFYTVICNRLNNKALIRLNHIIAVLPVHALACRFYTRGRIIRPAG